MKHCLFVAALCLAPSVARSDDSTTSDRSKAPAKSIQQVDLLGPLKVSKDTARVLAARYPRNAQHLRRIEQQVQKVVERALPATVAVFVGHSAGSGVIVNPTGTVLTAAHVVGRSGRRVQVILPDGRNLPGKSLGANHDIDAGMIQLIDPPDDLPYIPLAKQRLRLGEWVVTTGQPGGLVENRPPPVRLGRVLFREGDLVCTDCTLVGGDSGGPLINMRGEVVAIHSSIGPKITHNFHVAATGFNSDWDRLADGEVWGGQFDEALADALKNRPMVGVSGRTVDGQCLITKVWPGLPAEAAGIRVDDVITDVDGRAITSFDELSRIIFFRKPGAKIELGVTRGDRSWKTKVRITTAAELHRQSSSPED